MRLGTSSVIITDHTRSSGYAGPLLKGFIETLDQLRPCSSLLLKVSLLSIQGGLDVFITSLAVYCTGDLYSGKASYWTSIPHFSQLRLQSAQQFYWTAPCSLQLFIVWPPYSQRVAKASCATKGPCQYKYLMDDCPLCTWLSHQ